MNKIEILFVLLGMGLMISCDKNIHDPVNIKTDNNQSPLHQTTWAGVSPIATLMEGGGEWYQYYEFSDSVNCKKYYQRHGGIKRFVDRGTYSYNDSTRMAILRLNDNIDTLVFDTVFSHAKFYGNEEYCLWLQ